MFSTSRFRLLPIVAVLMLTGMTASFAHAAGPDRLVWSYEGGYFRDQDADGWVERNPSGEYHFKEVRRNREFIELYDCSRDCTVRLYKDAMFLKGFNGEHPDFIKFYCGRWTQ